jgi:hypothetical protein
MEYIMLLPVILSGAAIAFVAGLSVWDEFTIHLDAKPARQARPAPRATPVRAYAAAQPAE